MWDDIFYRMRKFRDLKLNKMKIRDVRELHGLVPLAKLIEEIGEVTQLMNCDIWKKRKVSKEEYAEELIDVLFFYVDVCDNLGLTERDLKNAFEKKLEKNYDRFDDDGVFR